MSNIDISPSPESEAGSAADVKEETVKDSSVKNEEPTTSVNGVSEEEKVVNGETNGVKKEKKEKEEDKEEVKPINSAPNQLDDVGLPRESRNRVKLYVLCEQRVWDDRGTGHVACVPQPGNQSAFVIIVKLESTEKNVLESKILTDTVYQKQQETLIVWSESESCDLALSFQEKSGCEEIWAKICEVQGRDPGDADGGFDDLDEGELSEGSCNGRVTFPPVEMGRLTEIDQVISSHMTTASMREKMTTILENEDVIPKIVDVFRMCEDVENTEGLHLLYTIAKNIILLSRVNIQDVTFMEKVFQDSHLKDFIGMLEYDPAHDEPRKHREFLYEKAKFREVLTISSNDIKEKIHKVFRVQYIQDVCLPAPSLFEENLMGTMNSYLFFLRVEICTALQKDKKFMKDLFDQLRSPSTAIPVRRDLVFFLKEFLNLSQSFPGTNCHQKEVIVKSLLQGLFNADILSTVEPCVKSCDYITRTTMVELLWLLVEHNPQLVREFLLKQAKDKPDNEVLLNKLIHHMLSDQDCELSSANHVSNIMRALLDPDSMVTMQKSERTEFSNLFYHRSIHTLVKPMIENVQGGKIANDDYCTANKQALVVRLLCFCIEHHSFSMRQHCISSDLLNKVLVLLSSRHHFLSLCALKMLRTVLTVKDDFYLRYIVREKVLDKVVACYVKNGPRYNLLNSAMLELFQFITSENIKILSSYVVENHMSSFENVVYVKVFSDMRLRYEQQKEREAGRANNNKEDRVSSPATFTKERQEEQWFDEDDDNASENKKDIKKETESPSRKAGFEQAFPSVLRRKNAIDEDDAPVFSGHSTPLATEKKIVIKMGDRSRTPSPVTSPLPSPLREDEVSSSQSNSKEGSPQPVKSLVDYGDSDSDEDDTSTPGPSTPSDSLPSSSTGSPVNTQDDLSDESPSTTSPGPEDSVSSTSNENDENMQRRNKRPSSEPLEDITKRSRTTSEG